MVQGQNVPGTDFGLELALRRLEESFNEAAAGRIGNLAVQQSDVETEAGGLEGAGVIDLGVVDIEGQGRAVAGPGTQQ